MSDLMTIYIVYNKKTKFTKIGITEDFHRRLDQLQNGCGNKLELVAKGKLKAAQEIERFIHISLDSYRLHGEWFELTMKEMNWLRYLWRSVFPSDDMVNEIGYVDNKFAYAYEVAKIHEYNYFDLSFYERKGKKQIPKLRLAS